MTRRVIWRRYGMGGDAGGNVVELQSPGRAPQLAADVLVPMLQAVTTGLVFGLAAAAVLDLTGRAAFVQAAPASVAICAALAWLWRLRASDSTLWVTDSIVADQRDQAPATEASAPETHVMLVSDYREQQRARLELQWKTGLLDFVDGCAGPGGTGIRRWESKIGRERYMQYRDTLLRAHLAKWRNNDPRSGWVLTSDPAECRRALVGDGDGFLHRDRIAQQQARRSAALAVVK